MICDESIIHSILLLKKASLSIVESIESFGISIDDRFSHPSNAYGLICSIKEGIETDLILRDPKTRQS